MFKYVLEFSKRGYIKYTSHLDLQRIMKRAFRRAGIELQYSRGYNPHPRMSLAQPLSLSYEADAEWLEIETEEPVSAHRFLTELQKNFPEGIQIVRCGEIKEKKSLAASVSGAVYTVCFPVPYYREDFPAITKRYLEQKQIIVQKKQKKSKELREVDIREKIRTMTTEEGCRGKLRIRLELDCGSASNLSPELVIRSFLDFTGLSCRRYEIDVTRNGLILPLDYAIRWM